MKNGNGVKRLGTEVVGSLFWLAVGVFFAVGGIMLRPGTLRNPGPGFLPLVMALLLVAFSLVVLARGLMGQGKILQAIPWKSQSVLVAAVFLYGALLDFLGFLFSTFVLMCILFGCLFKGGNRWPKVFFSAAATALAGWLLFAVALKMPFPKGQLLAFWR